MTTTLAVHREAVKIVNQLLSGRSVNLTARRANRTALMNEVQRILAARGIDAKAIDALVRSR